MTPSARHDLARPGGNAHVTLAREITGCLKEDS